MLRAKKMTTRWSDRARESQHAMHKEWFHLSNLGCEYIIYHEFDSVILVLPVNVAHAN